MKIYTRTGDAGTTSLFGGNRVSKTHSRIDAYGTVDELNSYLGLVRALLSDVSKTGAFDTLLKRIQGELLIVGADLATPLTHQTSAPRIEASFILRLEQDIDIFDRDLQPLRNFILPGGSATGATLHVARTVCRRAERLTVKAGKDDAINDCVIVYLNRLSDLLFVLARWINAQTGQKEGVWNTEKG